MTVLKNTQNSKMTTIFHTLNRTTALNTTFKTVFIPFVVNSSISGQDRLFSTKEEKGYKVDIEKIQLRKKFSDYNLGEDQKRAYYNQTNDLFDDKLETEILDEYLLLFCRTLHKDCHLKSNLLKQNWEDLIQKGESPFISSTHPFHSRKNIKIIRTPHNITGISKNYKLTPHKTGVRMFSTSQTFFDKADDVSLDADNVNTINFFMRMRSNNPFNQFDPNVFGSNAFYRLKFILSDTMLSMYDKQQLLETNLKGLWEYELKQYFENIKSLDNKGIRLLVEVLSILEKDFETLFKDNKLLARKNYLKTISSLECSNILSICLSKVISIIMFRGDEPEHQVTSLFESVGTALYKEVIKDNYKIYTQSLANSETVKMSFKEYYFENYDYSNEDSIRLGAFIIIFISEKSDLYLIDNIKSSSEETKRVIKAGKLFEELMNDLVLFDSYEAPMIVKPVKWVIRGSIKPEDISKDTLSPGILENPTEIIKKKQENNFTNKIIKYGGYLQNDTEDFKGLIRKSKESLGDSIIIDNKIVKMVNYMSSIPFRINKNVLNYLIELIIAPGKNDIIKDLNLSKHPKTYSLDENRKQLNKNIKGVKLPPGGLRRGGAPKLAITDYL